ncbi:MAG: hypothetical protein ACKOXO_05705 [Cyanobium sp.]
MRTTLTLDDALLRQLRQRALDRGQTFKQVVNDTLRAGLAASPAAPRQPYRCPTFSMGQPLLPVNLDKALTLAAELEDEELIRTLRAEI